MARMLAAPPADSQLDAVRGDGGVPIVGHTLEYMRDPLKLFGSRWEKYGDVSWLTMAGQRWITVLGPDACQEVLQNKDKAFVNSDGWSLLIGPFFHGGLMLLDDDEHLRHRRIMQQAFTRQRIAKSVDALNPVVAEGLDHWEPGADFRVYPALKALTLDVATNIFMGGAEGSTEAEIDTINASFVACVQAATSIVRYRVPGTRWKRGLDGRRVLEQFFRRYLPARRDNETDDLFSVLCHIESDTGQRFTDDEVIDHMIFLLMAAHDTSTITLSTMMQYLGQHPEWRERCRAEALALQTDSPTFQQLDELVDIDLVMKECLRLVSPTPVVARRAVKDTVVQGKYIPAGTYASVAPHFTHHMAQYWPNPEKFDPERFSAERREDKVHRYAWEPFGGGVHKCIGMYFAGAEIKTIMFHLLRRFEWSVDPNYTAPLNFTSLPFPEDGQPVNLRRR
ncbi:cytochrome P450 [Rhodococcus sp. BP-252]|uniref:cytochrome P450 n=1 Tax=unclassified Rhodococcus (in: high G+C Gram-positive bacteria) TaxID=192944 RepID=UPI001C9B384C|nr:MULTISPECIES: cytochrome P450 [unclassified Rhodococcus (in: high G+C Gram-positive bacteria)]MBY6414150.1 cytochrome P450 [Rhodococcus sp. BP-320]MBY6418875.1 cytochrome P450 [Rhodococcus sp. BP-321]MBY6423572.1 cytochrome P450 [Rhodococcus sp. BP-324]MBY6428909.1 cytochrome P450 [Rhodococcus sp. BP-323]MBY6433914.1 cytochrome P450 [Rhodococcus sp. BP-322]